MTQVVSQVQLASLEQAVFTNIDCLQDRLQYLYDESDRIALNNLKVETRNEFSKLSNKKRSYKRCFKILDDLSKKWLDFDKKYNNVSEISKITNIVFNYVKSYSLLFQGLVYLNESGAIGYASNLESSVIGLELIAEVFDLFSDLFCKVEVENYLIGIKTLYKNHSGDRKISDYFAQPRQVGLMTTRFRSLCEFIISRLEQRLLNIEIQPKDSWDAELAKYEQWDKDLEESEELTEKEEEAYKRVMQRLGA